MRDEELVQQGKKNEEEIKMRDEEQVKEGNERRKR